MITIWHSGCEDTPLGIYLSKNIHMWKSYPLDFQVGNKAASVRWTCSDKNNLMKHVKWKRRKCNVMKKKICHNKLLKSLHKFTPTSINQQIITLSIQKKLEILTFFRVFFQFLNSKLWSLMTFMPPSVFYSIPSIGLVWKSSNWIPFAYS